MTRAMTFSAACKAGSNAFVAKITDSNAAALKLSTHSLTFTGSAGATPVAQQFSISNIGTGTLNWAATKTQSCLALDTTSGSGPETVNVSVNLSGLTVGTYSDTITVSAANADGSPAEIAVTLTVQAGSPGLSVSATSLQFTATGGVNNAAAQALSIENQGTGRMKSRPAESYPFHEPRVRRNLPHHG
jgi:hypothetical protein